jgi:hypothetical protein
MMWRSSQKEKLLATMQAHTSRGAVPDIGVVPMRLENVQQKQSAPAGAYPVWQIMIASVGARRQLCWRALPVGTRTRQTWQRQIARLLYE